MQRDHCSALTDQKHPSLVGWDKQRRQFPPKKPQTSVYTYQLAHLLALMAPPGNRLPLKSLYSWSVGVCISIQCTMHIMSDPFPGAPCLL